MATKADIDTILALNAREGLEAAGITREQLEDIFDNSKLSDKQLHEIGYWGQHYVVLHSDLNIGGLEAAIRGEEIIIGGGGALSIHDANAGNEEAKRAEAEAAAKKAAEEAGERMAKAQQQLAAAKEKVALIQTVVPELLKAGVEPYIIAKLILNCDANKIEPALKAATERNALAVDAAANDEEIGRADVAVLEAIKTALPKLKVTPTKPANAAAATEEVRTEEVQVA